MNKIYETVTDLRCEQTLLLYQESCTVASNRTDIWTGGKRKRKRFTEKDDLVPEIRRRRGVLPHNELIFTTATLRHGRLSSSLFQVSTCYTLRTGLGKFSISWPMATGIAPEIPVTYVTYARSPWPLSTKVHSTSGFD